jgi:hypothetical protein
MKTLTRIALLILTATLCAGCIGSAAGIGLTAVVMNRYSDIPPDGRKGDTRFQDFEACAAKDNTSWDILDACMAGKGYAVNN